MYKYHHELEDIKNFKTYNYKGKYKSYYFQAKKPILDDTLYSILDEIFKRLLFIDTLIFGINEEIYYNCYHKNLTYEEELNWLNALEYKEDLKYQEFLDYRNRATESIDDLINLLNGYLICIDVLIEIFKPYQKYFYNTKELIKDVKGKLTKETQSFIIPTSERDHTKIWPNAWYLTPNGYLFNIGTDHKQGSLLYSYWEIRNKLLNNENISNLNHSDTIKKIKNQGYVTYANIRYYENYPDFEEIIINDTKKPFYEARCYQKNMNTLVLGHLYAENYLYGAFARLNKSKRKRELILKLEELTDDDIRDIILCFAGFHKIETQRERTITTTSLNVIEDFSEYLKEGWDIFVSRYLDKTLENYSDKGRVLIRHYQIK